MRVDVDRALGWRLRRHALEAPAREGVVDVVRRVVAVRAWPADLAEQAVAVRRAEPERGAVARALADGELVCVYAFRGGAYVMAHDDAAAVLTARTATRVWESARYQRQGGFAVDDWAPVRDAVLTALADGPRTRHEIADHLARVPALRHLAEAAASGAGADSLYKPLHWWGDICFGPPRDGRTTFRVLRGDARWPGPPDLDTAGRHALVRYLTAYAPATLDNVLSWLADGLSVPRRRVLAWLDDVGEVTTVRAGDVDAYVLTADADGLGTAEPSDAVRLVPGFDPWVLGPGTADARVVPPVRRALASKGSNLVVRGGVVAGTWRVTGDVVAVSWFREAGRAPTAALADEVARLADLRGDALGLEVGEQ